MYAYLSFPRKKSNPDPGGVHASVDAAWRSSWARLSDVPNLAECIQLGLLVSPFFSFFLGYRGVVHRFSSHTISPPCFGTTCLVDIAWLGNLAGRPRPRLCQLPRCVFPAWALTWSHLPFFLPYTVTHMCRNITGWLPWLKAHKLEGPSSVSKVSLLKTLKTLNQSHAVQSNLAHVCTSDGRTDLTATYVSHMTLCEICSNERLT